ncbi:hypothetical protein [Nonomuraea angiospora]|nr:hypothetical protein [Nonomuraea angiospora]MDX3106950.1 hypothetical protein [Nonomuraea angiospora]
MRATFDDAAAASTCSRVVPGAAILVFSYALSSYRLKSWYTAYAVG